MLEAIVRGHEALFRLIEIQKELAAAMPPQKMEICPVSPGDSLISRVKDILGIRSRSLVFVADKEEQKARREELVAELMNQLAEETEEVRCLARQAFDQIESDEMRRIILTESKRADGRRPDEVRPITIEVGFLPRTHGSASLLEVKPRPWLPQPWNGRRPTEDRRYRGGDHQALHAPL